MKNLLGDREVLRLRDVAVIAGFRSSSDPLEWLTEQERSGVAQWLARRETVEVVGHTRFHLDERDTDFASGPEEPEHCYPVSQSGSRNFVYVAPELIDPSAFRCVMSSH